MSLCSDQSRSIGPGFSEDNNDESLILEDSKRCKGSCGVCLGNIPHAVKHRKTSDVFYCETHEADHYRSPAFSLQELVDYKQTSRESPEHSLQLSRSDRVEHPKLRVMMLGMTGSGMSASGNTILGREAFKSEASALPVTKCCDSQDGVMDGHNITVIDTPAITTWKAAWLSEKEIQRPHVFLWVIPLRRFTEEDGKEVKWIQRNFGEEALEFTIVLFTGGDQLNGKQLEDFLQESSQLQTLLGHVEGRYHVFNNSVPEERYQVKVLINKIQNVLISKLGYAYTHEEQQKVKMVARREYEREKEKAEITRNQEEKNMRENQAYKAGIWMVIILSVLTALALRFHHYPEDRVELPELRVMMLGKTGTGKSASGNTILGREAFKSKASALPVTKSCDSQSGVVEGRNITVIDTPAITTRKAAWLSEKVDPGPHVFLLVIPLGRFTEEDGKEVKWIQSNFGEEALKFTIVLFTGGDQTDQINIKQFLKESSGLQTLISSTGGGYHIFDNKTPRGHGQVKGLLEKIELLLRKNMGYSYSYGLHEQVETAVREEEERKRRKEEKKRIKEEEERKKIKEEEERKRRKQEKENKRRKEEVERKRREEEAEQKRREEEGERKRRKEEEERKRIKEERERREEERKIRENEEREQSWSFMKFFEQLF